MAARSQDAVEAAAARLGGRGSAVGVVADLADPAVPGQLVEAALETFGRLDGALLSVGGPPVGGVSTATDTDWRAAFESVFLGAVRAARELVGHLGEGGSLVLVLSSSVRSPIPGLAISNGLRPGLAMVAKTLADEVGPRGIRVNGLLPGRISTERIQQLDSTRGQGAAEAAQAGIPLRRDGQPAELGRVAAFLLSPAASYVTGTMLAVDGGAARSY